MYPPLIGPITTMTGVPPTEMIEVSAARGVVLAVGWSLARTTGIEAEAAFWPAVS